MNYCRVYLYTQWGSKQAVVNTIISLGPCDSLLH